MSALDFYFITYYTLFMKLKNITAVLSAALLMAVITVSCATKPAEISGELSAAELIQRAQEATDRSRQSTSLDYYRAVLERFPNDLEYVCAAEYEIAFIYYKQKKYDISKTGFNSLLERYNTTDEELLPQQYKILAKKLLTSISENENRKKKPAKTQ